MIQKATLKLRVTKRSFTQSEVELPGHVINDTSVNVYTDKIKDILKLLLRRL